MPRLFRPAVLAPVAVVAALVGGTLVLMPGAKPLVLQGIGASSLNKATLASAVVSVDTGGHPTKLLIDGRQVASAATGRVTAALKDLADGVHEVTATVDRGFPRGTATSHRRLVVDATPPVLTVDPLKSPVRITSPVVLHAEAEPDATVTAEGGQVQPDGNGFTVRFPAPPIGGAKITAVDPAGNTTQAVIPLRTRYPDNIRAVHMTGASWAYSKLRLPVIALAQQHRINAIELDIKDEDGVVNFPSRMAMVARIGAQGHFYDAQAATAYLHRLGLRVIGRIVAFNDPKLSTWADTHGHKDWIIQNPDGSKYLYGYNKTGFSNFASQDVRNYNEALAVEAIKAGFDDVVYDYVRRPDGPIGKMRFPGLKGTPEDAIVQFLAETQAKIRPLGGSLGAAAFAQASTRPKSTAQNIAKMARHLDLVIPMDYPSHWNPGEYGVPDPYVGAYDIVRRSLVDWRKQVIGTSCVVVPWLQDENYKGNYTPAKVMQQIQGARDNGIPGWLMWSAAARYQGAAYTPDATPAR
ncbi:MAG: hypothetical protein JWN31_1321 [Frankiales bacterium]|nr:hypothetical protein [Frankiales bacterium]